MSRDEGSSEGNESDGGELEHVDLRLLRKVG